MADLGAVEKAIRVHIAGIEDKSNRSPPDRSTTQPDKSPKAAGQLTEIEHISGRQRIEIPSEKMEPVLMARDAREKRAQFGHPVPLGPRGVKGAQMQSEDSEFSRTRINLEE